jgi:hypothetical protein
MGLWLRSSQVSENKTKTETCISTTLAHIKERLPRISLQKCIHNDGDEVDTQLQQKVVEAYEAFMEFSIEAIRYYQLSGYSESSCFSSASTMLNWPCTVRWAQSLAPPIILNEKSTKAHQVVAEIRDICEVLMDKNLSIVKQEVQSMTPLISHTTACQLS